MISPQSKAVNGYLLNRAVLVLNSNYAPMTVCTAKRAICLQVLKKIDVIAKYDDEIHSPSISLNLPSVIKIRDYIRYNDLAVEISRKNILIRDDHSCQYCGTKMTSHLTVDHVLPRFRGGKDIW